MASLKNYLRIDIRENAAEYLAAPEDTDLLIVQKAATTSPNALVGKDTDPIVLLCYHAVLIPMTSSFIPGLKKFIASGALEPLRDCKCNSVPGFLSD